MKLVKLLPLVALNTLIWVLSEIHVHGGVLWVGLAKGVVVSALCVGMPFLCLAVIETIQRSK